MSLRGPHMSDGTYRERLPDPDLSGLVQCTWTRKVGDLESQREVRVVPDGCMDLLWMQDELLVAGPDTQAWLRRLPAGTTIAGLRFPPGVAPGLLHVPADELLNSRIPVLECSAPWANRVAENLFNAPEAAAAIMQDAVKTMLQGDDGKHDPVVRHVVRTVSAAPCGMSMTVRDLADEIGLSERQLHRRCSHALGYGLKTFTRIVRFQRFMERVGQQSPPSLAWLAADSGYADQSHLSRDVRQLTGLTPSELLSGQP